MLWSFSWDILLYWWWWFNPTSWLKRNWVIIGLNLLSKVGQYLRMPQWNRPIGLLVWCPVSQQSVPNASKEDITSQHTQNVHNYVLLYLWGEFLPAPSWWSACALEHDNWETLSFSFQLMLLHVDTSLSNLTKLRSLQLECECASYVLPNRNSNGLHLNFFWSLSFYQWTSGCRKQ